MHEGEAMRTFLPRGLSVLLVAAFCSALFAGARDDLRIKTETDEKRYKIYKLVNTGEQTVRATVEVEKRCSSVANNQKPSVREYWISPNQSIQLARVWPQTTCKRTYRIVEADYPDSK